MALQRPVDYALMASPIVEFRLKFWIKQEMN